MNTLSNNEREDITNIVKMSLKLGAEKVIAVVQMVKAVQHLSKDEVMSVFGELLDGKAKRA